MSKLIRVFICFAIFLMFPSFPMSAATNSPVAISDLGSCQLVLTVDNCQQITDGGKVIVSGYNQGGNLVVQAQTEGTTLINTYYQSDGVTRNYRYIFQYKSEVYTLTSFEKYNAYDLIQTNYLFTTCPEEQICYLSGTKYVDNTTHTGVEKAYSFEYYSGFAFGTTPKVKTQIKYQGNLISEKITINLDGKFIDVKKYGSNGRVTYDYDFYSNQKISVIRAYYSSGTIAKYQGYYSTGNIKTRSDYYTNGNRKYLKAFSANGDTQSYRTWWSNGNTKSISLRKNNKQVSYATYRSSGKISNYYQYYANGNWKINKVYYQTGKIKQYRSRLANKKYTQVVNYNQQSKRKNSFIFYANGSVKNRYLYRSNGQLYSRITYTKSGRISHVKYY